MAKHSKQEVSYNSSPAQYARSNYGSAARHAKAQNNTFWKWVFRISVVVFVAALLVLGGIVAQYMFQRAAYDDLKQYAAVDEENLSLADLTVDWDHLQSVNPDIVAWFYVPNTDINYPVVQGVDNDEYLHKSFNGTTGPLASAGTVFLDSTNADDFGDQNSALYGHHMNDGSMFAAMADWVDSDTFNQNRDIYLLTPQGNYRLTTFAVVKTTGSDAIVETSFSDNEAFANYIQDKLDRSVVTQDGTVLEADDISQSMLFSTCEYSQDNGRAVIFAAVVETTVDSDPWMQAVEEGQTGLSSDEDAALDNAAEED